MFFKKKSFFRNISKTILVNLLKVLGIGGPPPPFGKSSQIIPYFFCNYYDFLVRYVKILGTKSALRVPSIDSNVKPSETPSYLLRAQACVHASTRV